MGKEEENLNPPQADKRIDPAKMRAGRLAGISCHVRKSAKVLVNNFRRKFVFC